MFESFRCKRSSGLDWECTVCGEMAKYHYCNEETDGKHVYLCDKCNKDYGGRIPTGFPS